jgi:hypothetical protein
MDRREAKRRAYRIAAMALEGVEAVELSTYYLDDDENLTDEDVNRIQEALRELSRELWRRGGGEQQASPEVDSRAAARRPPGPAEEVDDRA